MPRPFHDRGLVGEVVGGIADGPEKGASHQGRTADGAKKQYKIFATSKVALLRYGWRPDSVKPGDTITIEGRPDRTDETQLYRLRITFADGTAWSRDEILQ